MVTNTFNTLNFTDRNTTVNLINNSGHYQVNSTLICVKTQQAQEPWGFSICVSHTGMKETQEVEVIHQLLLIITVIDEHWHTKTQPTRPLNAFISVISGAFRLSHVLGFYLFSSVSSYIIPTAFLLSCPWLSSLGLCSVCSYYHLCLFFIRLSSWL